MAGYASDQFYNFGVGYEKGTSISRTSDDNPNFIWPRRVQPDVYNPIQGRQTVDTRLQRGFIRGIYPTVLGGKTSSGASQAKKRRLFFQFNPETIDRSVAMNAMVANPLLQDPSQLFQPVAGTAAFSFELRFNREAEVVSAQYATQQRKGTGWATDTANPITSSLDIYGGKVDGKGVDFSHSDVASLGVLADMYVLDSIIGQSITPDMVGFIRDYFSTATNAQQNYAATTGGASVAAFDTNGFETNVTKNFGNGAFLSPLPVRIVFSSLFMVEGFVEATSVRFAKFSHNYVPTVCAVSLQVRALYIGFAKEEAYLTTALKAAVKDFQTTKTIDDLQIASAKQMTELGVKFTYTTPNLTKNYADDSKNWTYGANVAGFSTAQDFWNAGIWPAGDAKPSGGSDLLMGPYSGAGEVRSWVSPALAKAVTDGKMSLKISSQFIVDEIDPTSKTVVKTLLTAPMAYIKHSAGSDTAGMDQNQVTNEKIAEDIVKATSESKARKNKYVVKNDKQSSGDAMTKATNMMRFTIQNTIVITVNTSSGPVDVTNIVSDHVDLSATIGVAGSGPVTNDLISATNGQLTLRLAKDSYGIRMGGPT